MNMRNQIQTLETSRFGPARVQAAAQAEGAAAQADIHDCTSS